MSRHFLQDVAALLQQRYRSVPEPGPLGEWLTLVRIVLDRSRSAKGKTGDWSWIGATPLRAPGETAALTGPQLAESLESAGHGVREAGALWGLAQWWMKSIGEQEPGAVFQQRSLEAQRQELRAIRGVSWELADRILLFVGGLAVYPLDRGSMRIAARHGWMEMTSEFDDWQAFFVGGLRDADVDLGQVAMWNAQLGREFCGKEPKCEECPLRTLLPERGPVALEGEE